MNATLEPETAAARPPSLEAGGDAFARAMVALSELRPIRNARLRELAARLWKGDVEAAESDLHRYLARQPDDPDALVLKGQAASRRGRRREALAVFARCVDLAPDFRLARFEYTNLLWQLHEYGPALEQLDWLLAEDGGNPVFRQIKANILETLGENEASLAINEELTAENPQRAECWLNYGHGLRAVGAQEKSIAAYRKAIACRPSYGQAYWSLANLKTVAFAETDVAAIATQLKRSDIATGDRVPLQFALGKAYEDMRAYERAFEQYAKANATMRPHFNYDPELLGTAVAENKALFTPDFFQNRTGWGNPASDPIFVLGRPRSGSTLIEQILSSHPAIEGTAELPYIIDIAERLGGMEGGPVFRTDSLKVLAEMAPAASWELGAEYLRKAQLHRKLSRPFFIDKKPANFVHVGMILLILPNARIIDARRHPAASGFSSFKMYSSNSRLRLAELGRFYRDYVELMAHFDAALPGRIHRVIYEHLVAYPEREVRRLLDYLGLPFDQSCLRFYETKRTVLTPSSEQVRKPISAHAIEYWRHFQPWLGPLIASLGSALDDYPVVPPDLR